MKTLILLCSALLMITPLFAQEKPPQEQQDPQQEMPKLKPDAYPFNMPNQEFLKAFGTDPETGEPHYYLDPATGLYFDFYEKKIRNFKNGEVYTFEELKKLLEQKRQEVNEPKKKII